jgi:hypothetical protein
MNVEYIEREYLLKRLQLTSNYYLVVLNEHWKSIIKEINWKEMESII